MINRIGTVYPWGSNKGFSSRFCVDSRVWHETPEEGWKTHQPKHCDYNNKDELNRSNILSNKNYQASSQRFRQIKIKQDFFQAVALSMAWKQHPTKQQLYSHIPPIWQTIQIKWTRHAGVWWWSKDELVSDILLWTSTQGYTSKNKLTLALCGHSM